MDDLVDEALILKEMRREIMDIRRDLRMLRDQEASGFGGRKGTDIALRDGIQLRLAAIQIEKRIEALERRVSDMERRRATRTPLD